MDQRPNIRLDTIKLLEENIDIKSQENLFQPTFQSNENKSQRKQMESN